MTDNKIVNALPLGTELEGGKYKVEQALGQGSFGITYKASLHLGGSSDSRGTIINVAVKEFFMGMNERDGTRVIGCYNDTFRHYKKKFVDEANKLRLFDNSKIVKVIDAFEANNTAYYVMEYIEGGSLNNYITKYGKLNVDEAVRLIKQIGEAIEYIHGRRMLHLDLKPSNIVLRKNGDVVVIDFGLAKLFDDKGKPETSSTIGLGTKGYAPLEQANYNADSSKRLPVTMDVYALGAILFKMLTGTTPPDASLILNDGFPAEELEVEGVDVALISCIAKAMSPKVTDRFQTVKDFVNSIKYEKEQTTSQKTIEGSVDESTIFEVEPSYIASSITPYYEGLARVLGENGKFGFVNMDKKVVIPLEWRQATFFTNGLAEVMNDNGKWGYIDKSGNLVIPCKWELTSAFKDGIALVRNSEGEILYIDKKGNKVALDNHIEHIKIDSAATKEEGCIVVTSFPSGAHVRVDNVYKGVTPITMKVSTGMHEVNVQSEKYKFTKWKHQGIGYIINIHKGQTKDIYADFVRIKEKYEPEAKVVNTFSLGTKERNHLLSYFFDSSNPNSSFLLSSTLISSIAYSLLYLLRILLLGKGEELYYYFLSLSCLPGTILLTMSFFGIIHFIRSLINDKYEDITVWDSPRTIFISTPLICGILIPLLHWSSGRSVFMEISLFLSLFIAIIEVVSVNFIALKTSVMKSCSLLGFFTLTLIVCCTYLDPIHNVSSYIEKSLLFFSPIYLICLIIGLIWGKANGINFKYKNVWTYILSSILILIIGWVILV